MGFNLKEIPKHVFMKSDDVKAECLFIVHRTGNDHQTPYLIFHDGKFKLMNLHSHYVNYSGDTIEELIEGYLASNNSGLNPIGHYFFARRWKAEVQVEDTFGWKETGFKKKSPKQAMEDLKKIQGNVDKSNK